jgi:hypothetical protein
MVGEDDRLLDLATTPIRLDLSEARSKGADRLTGTRWADVQPRRVGGDYPQVRGGVGSPRQYLYVDDSSGGRRAG